MSDTVNVAAGQTLTVASGDTVESSEVINAGTVSNAGTVQADLVQQLDAAASDTDTATATLQRNRSLTAAASDADTATATLQRNRSLIAAASDADTATATTNIIGRVELAGVASDTDTATATTDIIGRVELAGVASDTDTATATRKRQLEITAPNDPVQVVVDLLDAEGSGAFAVNGKPVIKRYFDDAPAERGPGAGQQPVIYVYSPTSATLDRHSMDDQQFNRQNTLQVLIMSLQEDEVIDLVGSVVQILSQFLQDNRSSTPFNDLAPTQTSDFRRQTSARNTDHFVTQVTVETTNLPDTGLANR
jgi:hypothetical protein